MNRTDSGYFQNKKAFNFNGSDFFARFLLNNLRMNRMNKIYSGLSEKKGLEFISEVVRMLRMNIDLDEKELSRIPPKGPVVVVANHPFGGFDSLLLIKYLSKVRGDIKIWDDSAFKQMEPVAGYFIQGGSRNNSDLQGPDTREADAHLKNSGLLCIFPAGSGKPVFNGSLAERIWKYHTIRFIKSAGVPVVPVFFQKKGTRFAQLLKKITPLWQIGKIPAELLGSKPRNIKIRIGNSVPVDKQQAFDDVYKFGRYLRAKTFCLESNLEVKPFFNYSLKRGKKPAPVIEPVPVEMLLKDIAEIKEEYTLFGLKNYRIYCAPSMKIPNVMREIGRLREITFRQVGEGTNQSIDVDEFDLYYHQMFIWDEDENKIVGAYRIGMGKEILGQYGKRGFYLQTLFRMTNGFIPVLNESLELGRSFVVQEYQRKPLPLFLLWKGILYFLLKNPEYRYLIGPVSISNNYSRISKELIIKFILANHFDRQMAVLVKPRNAYQFKNINEDIRVLMENMDGDIGVLDQTIGDLDELNSGLPVLLKKYIKLNAKIIAFNVDPKFNNCLDGFILLDVFKVPENVIESLSKDVNDGTILERFYSNRE